MSYLMGIAPSESTAVANANPTHAETADRGKRVNYSPKQTERAFQQQVIQLAQLKGWKVCHFRPARVIIKGVETWRTPLEGDRGCPDMILARGGVVLLWELKAEAGKVTAEEQEWLDASGGKVMRPSNWAEIVDTLS